MAGAETRDRGVVRRLVGADDPGRDVLVATPLDRPRGPHSERIAVEQQRDHHRWIVRRPAVTVGPIGAIERPKIDLADDVDDQPRQVILADPFPQTRRQQQRLLAITPQEVLRHP
jgi:hypothetical protein